MISNFLLVKKEQCEKIRRKNIPTLPFKDFQYGEWGITSGESVLTYFRSWMEYSIWDVAISKRLCGIAVQA